MLGLAAIPLLVKAAKPLAKKFADGLINTGEKLKQAAEENGDDKPTGEAPVETSLRGKAQLPASQRQSRRLSLRLRRSQRRLPQGQSRKRGRRLGSDAWSRMAAKRLRGNGREFEDRLSALRFRAV